MTARAPRTFMWGAGLVLLAILAGCLAPAPTDPTAPVTRHNWWNYYQRGLALLAAGNPAMAREDFERALGSRSGARFGDDEDRWRARTYGLHFVEGYFPNRELGIALFELGDTPAAIRSLERSLGQTPSSRAKHYLNLAREKQVKAQPPRAPAVQLEDAGVAGPAPALTRERTAWVRGTVDAPGFARRLTVAGREQPVELAQASLPFAVRVPLHEGNNAIRVEAVDLAGRSVTAERTWIADWRPPQLSISSLDRQADNRWRVTGVCRDDRALQSLVIDGTEIRAGASAASRARPFDVTISRQGAAVVAVDAAGNRLEARITPDLLAPADAARSQAGRYALAAATAVAATDAGSGVRLAAATTTPASEDRLPPSLNFRGTRDFCVVFDEEFFLDGIASDNGGLGSITVNGEDLLADEDRGAVRGCFARRIPLTLGTNVLNVAAADRAGNRTARQMTVVRRLPEHLDAALRLSVGVPPMLPEGVGATGVRAKRGLESELTRDPVRFRLLERDEGWDYVLREQGLSVSDLADPRAALRIGKLVPAEILLLGRVINEARGLTVFVKAVDTASGEVLYTADVYSVDPDRTLDEDAANLVMKLKQGFPLVSGEVLKRQGNLVTLSIGLRDGVNSGSRFLVSAGLAPGADADGRVRRMDGRLVQLSLEQVRRDSGTARIIPAEARDAVKEGDHVYAR
jgi:hypothetical protein